MGMTYVKQRRSNHVYITCTLHYQGDIHIQEQTFTHTVLTETTVSFVFVAKTNVWTRNAKKNATECLRTAAMFVSLTDLVARQTVA